MPSRSLRHGFSPLLLCSLLSFHSLAAPPQLSKSSDTVVDPEALYFTEGRWGNSVNGESFQQDALTTSQGWQYAIYYNAARRLCLARRPTSASQWEIIRFDDYHFAGNDTHNVAVVGICPADGSIHLSFDHHGSPLHYRRSLPGVALTPQKFKWTSSLFGGTTSELEPGKPLSRVTYPRFLRAPNGTLQFTCRLGGSGNGDKCLADYSPRAGSWTNFGGFIGRSGAYGTSSDRNPYLNGLTYDLNRRLHITWCWRETGDPMSNHDLNYAWSDDLGRTWFNNSGGKIGERGAQLVNVNSPEVTVVKLLANRGLANATTQAADQHGRPHLVTFHLADDAPAQLDWTATRSHTVYFHYWRDDSGTWNRNQLGFSGCRPQLQFDAADNAWLVFTGDRYQPSDVLSIAFASAKGLWRDWKIIHREPGPFTGQPRLASYGPPGTLSIYVQEAPGDPFSAKSPLRVIEFNTRPK